MRRRSLIVAIVADTLLVPATALGTVAGLAPPAGAATPTDVFFSEYVAAAPAPRPSAAAN
jgi:hypothetical protein